MNHVRLLIGNLSTSTDLGSHPAEWRVQHSCHQPTLSSFLYSLSSSPQSSSLLHIVSCLMVKNVLNDGVQPLPLPIPIAKRQAEAKFNATTHTLPTVLGTLRAQWLGVVRLGWLDQILAVGATVPSWRPHQRTRNRMRNRI